MRYDDFPLEKNDFDFFIIQKYLLSIRPNYKLVRMAYQILQNNTIMICILQQTVAQAEITHDHHQISQLKNSPNTSVSIFHCYIYIYK